MRLRDEVDDLFEGVFLLEVSEGADDHLVLLQGVQVEGGVSVRFHSLHYSGGQLLDQLHVGLLRGEASVHVILLQGLRQVQGCEQGGPPLHQGVGIRQNSMCLLHES